MSIINVNAKLPISSVFPVNRNFLHGVATTLLTRTSSPPCPLLAALRPSKVFSEIKLKAKISHCEGRPRETRLFFMASFAYIFRSAFLCLSASFSSSFPSSFPSSSTCPLLALLYLRWWHPCGPSAKSRCLRNVVLPLVPSLFLFPFSLAFIAIPGRGFY